MRKRTDRNYLFIKDFIPTISKFSNLPSLVVLDIINTMADIMAEEVIKGNHLIIDGYFTTHFRRIKEKNLDGTSKKAIKLKFNKRIKNKTSKINYNIFKS
jgi:hypothetical protein